MATATGAESRGRNNAMSLLFAVALGLSLIAPASGQDRAFSTISVGVDLAKDLSQSDFQRIWSSRLGADVYAETPFYAGNVRIGARYLRAVSPTLTNVRTLHLRAAWGPSIQIGRHLTALTNVSVGSFYMSFEDEPVDYRRSESELAFGASAAIVVRLSKGFSWEFTTEWAHAFTATPLNFVFVSSGLRYELKSPEWLRSFLQ